jgi:hypothetical protein
MGEKLNTSPLRPGASIRSLWTSEEAYIVKNFIANFTVRPWKKSYAMVDRTDTTGAWVIYVPKGGGGSAVFNGKAYTPEGIVYDGLTDAAKPWIKYDLSTGQITEEVGPPAEPWGSNETWRYKADVAGAIYF